MDIYKNLRAETTMNSLFSLHEESYQWTYTQLNIAILSIQTQNNSEHWSD